MLRGSAPTSSPHLVQVRERIRINGQPISRELFSKYFWLVYNRLEETKVRLVGPLPGLCIPLLVGDTLMPSPCASSACQEPAHASMPAYFRFLTIMAFHVFLQEKVGGGDLQIVMGFHIGGDLKWGGEHMVQPSSGAERA